MVQTDLSALDSLSFLFTSRLCCRYKRVGLFRLREIFGFGSGG